MSTKSIFAEKSAFTQSILLVLCMLVGTILASLLGVAVSFLLYGSMEGRLHEPEFLRIFQTISAIGLFLLPAMAVAWMCSSNVSHYLSLDRLPKGRAVLWTIVGMLLLSPAITLTGLLNEQLTLPPFLAPVEAWMRAQEAAAEQVTGILLVSNSLPTLLANLFVIAVVAAVTEEFLFRGTIQRIIGRQTTNHHLIIWVAAILFSAFHMQFFGFIPRLLLGAYFGYLLLWSKSIWLPVFAHFVNNAIVVIGMSNEQWKESEFISGDISTEQLPMALLIGVVCLVGFWGSTRLLYRALSKG